MPSKENAKGFGGGAGQGAHIPSEEAAGSPALGQLVRAVPRRVAVAAGRHLVEVQQIIQEVHLWKRGREAHCMSAGSATALLLCTSINAANLHLKWYFL
jgi:hypothetical protein